MTTAEKILIEAAKEVTKWANTEDIRERNPNHPIVLLADALAAYRAEKEMEEKPIIEVGQRTRE